MPDAGRLVGDGSHQRLVETVPEYAFLWADGVRLDRLKATMKLGHAGLISDMASSYELREPITRKPRRGGAVLADLSHRPETSMKGVPK